MKLPIVQEGLVTCICLFWLQYLGILCFLYGFLPMKTPVGGYASREDYTAFYNNGDEQQRLHNLSEIHRPKRMIGQMVFMVIDALRADFVFPFEQLNQTGLKFKRINDLDNPDKGKKKRSNYYQRPLTSNVSIITLT